LWVNGALVGDDLSKALLSGTTNINAFRFYGENSTGNVATIAIDNIRWWNQAVAPSMSIYSTIPTVSSNTYTDLNVNSGSASLSGDVTVDRVLTLAGGDITTGSNTLTLGSSATSSGDYDVVGNVKRSSFTTGSSYSFGNPNVTVNFASADILPTDVTVTLAKTQPTGFPYAVDRTYTVAGTGGSGYSATLRLRYKDSELHLNPPATESNLYILKYSGGAWVKQTRSNIDTTNNWVETSGVTSFSDWTISGNTPTALHLRTLTARPAPSPLALALPLLGLAALGGGLLARRRRAA
jgi:ribosomal protein S8E